MAEVNVFLRIALSPSSDCRFNRSWGAFSLFIFWWFACFYPKSFSQAGHECLVLTNG